MSENTFIACDKIGEAWFNNDLARFAAIPGTDEDPAKTAGIVEDIWLLPASSARRRRHHRRPCGAY